MVRYEFGPSSCSRLAHWLGEALCRGPSSDGLWVARNRPGRVVDPLDALYFLRGGERPERRLQAEGSVDLLDDAGNSARIEIVISAPRGAA